MIEFEWSEFKEWHNYQKHGVWFEEAKAIWKDPFALDSFDSENSDEEDRFVKRGHSSGNRLLIVVYCEKNNGYLIRIISARVATQKEREQYEEGI